MVRWIISTLLVFAFSAQASAQVGEVPAIDPSREWMGPEYADTVFGEFKRQNPDIDLVVDINDLYIESVEAEWNLKHAAQKYRSDWEATGKPDTLGNWSLRERLVSAVKAALPTVISTVAGALEFGQRIGVRDRSLNQEKALEAWILNQPDSSVAPHELMIEALRLTKGRVLAAWAITWNLTRDGYELAAVRNYSAVRSKLISLTGERHLWQGSAHYIALPKSEWTEVESSVENNGKTETVKSQKRMKMVITKRGDEFSYLYHRVGVELFSMVAAKLTGSVKLGWMLGTAGAVGEFVKYPSTAGRAKENVKRVNNDRLAAVSGSRFYQLAIGDRTIDTSLPRSARNYLRSNKLMFGTSYQLPPGTPPWYFGIQVDPKFHSDTMSEEELKMRFYHATRVDSDVLDPIMLASTGEGERIHRGLVNYMKSGTKNAELNKYIIEWREGADATPRVLDVTQDLDVEEKTNLKFARELAPDFEFEKYEKWLLNLTGRALAVIEENRNRESAQSFKRNLVPPLPPRQQGAMTCPMLF